MTLASPSRACLDTSDAILLDGANSVCGASREHFPNVWRDGALALAVAIALVVLRRRQLREVLALVLVAAALPGLRAILEARADAPAQRPWLAADVHDALGPLLESSSSPATPARLVRNDDGPFAPLFFYAHPVHTLPGDGDVNDQELVDVREGPLRYGCDRDLATKALVCGKGYDE
jgi:hypothetical protein